MKKITNDKRVWQIELLNKYYLKKCVHGKQRKLGILESSGDNLCKFFVPGHSLDTNHRVSC